MASANCPPDRRHPAFKDFKLAIQNWRFNRMREGQHQFLRLWGTCLPTRLESDAAVVTPPIPEPTTRAPPPFFKRTVLGAGWLIRTFKVPVHHQIKHNPSRVACGLIIKEISGLKRKLTL
jgi:hypothetical protein